MPELLLEHAQDYVQVMAAYAVYISRLDSVKKSWSFTLRKLHDLSLESV